MKFLKFNNSHLASEFVKEQIIKQIKTKPESILGLATGSTPIISYNLLVQDFQKNKTNWSKVKTFNLDEYIGLPTNHIQSYRYFMNDNLFNHINIDINNTYFPNSKNDYDKLIEKEGGIDLQILGIGTNGHIGFNEPGSKLTSLTRAVDLVEQTIKINADKFFNGNISLVPNKAFSMGLASILAAKKIILIALGNSKKETMQKLFKTKEFNSNFPASALIKHKDVIIVCDKECAPDGL